MIPTNKEPTGSIAFPLHPSKKEARQFRSTYFEKNPKSQRYESNTMLGGMSYGDRQARLERERARTQANRARAAKPVVSTSTAKNPNLNDIFKPIKITTPKQTMPTKKSDMVKKSKMYRFAQAASHALCKRAVASSVDPVLQAIQNEVREKYIKSLKRVRDRSILEDLLLASAKGSMSGGAIGMIPGGLFGAATMPIRDRGTSIPLHDSLLRGGSTGLLSGLLIGGTLGAGANAVGALLTRDARKADAAAKLKALGVKA